MPPAEIALPLRLGTRTLWTVRRQLHRKSLTLEDALSGRLPELPPLSDEGQGYLVTGVPAALAPRLADLPGLRPFVRQSYPRSYADLQIGFDAYMARFSGKSRSTLRRKTRRLAERCGGTLDVRAYRTESEIDAFHAAARCVSRRTYQERLLDSGLPDGEAAIGLMRSLARADRVRAWLLFIGDRPTAYLYAPAEGKNLVYAHLGYDPDFADWSPGTVLQLHAMRELMEEGRFFLFDFTEGDGQHKRLFATDSIPCTDFLLLRPTVSNLALGHGLGAFDGLVSAAKTGLRRAGLRR